MTIGVVAWDFDGVLNRNIVDGRFLWAERFEVDVGRPLAAFSEHVFGDGFEDILTGREDLRDRVAAWARSVGFVDGPDAVLDYWFTNEAHPDAMLLDIMDRLRRCGVRQVIATNNEPRRARYIEQTMGYGARVERVFASGHLGVCKPDPAFFEAVRAAVAVPAAAMLLVDDSVANVDAARRLGWQAIHVTDRTRDQLADLLGLVG